MNYVEATTKIVVAMIENGCISKGDDRRVSADNVVSAYKTIYNAIANLESIKNDKNLEDYNSALEEINAI